MVQNNKGGIEMTAPRMARRAALREHQSQLGATVSRVRTLEDEVLEKLWLTRCGDLSPVPNGDAVI